MLTIQILVISIVIFKVLNLVFLKVSRDDSSSGAIVMALGIFLVGAIKEFPWLDEHIGIGFTILLITLWVLIIASYIETAFKGFFKRRYLRHPIKSFSLGTWVASSSIVGVVTFHNTSNLDLFIYFLLFVTITLWVLYMFISALSLKNILMNKLFDKVHGVILLPAVSTQSLVILYSEIIAIESKIFWAINYFGLSLYLVGFSLILYRYIKNKQWELTDDWNNTNCILHGALSITGIAAYFSNSMSPFFLFHLWIIALLVFLTVEIIEIKRMINRIQKYGIHFGIGIYHVSQWSRNFTLGTFFMFTFLTKTHVYVNSFIDSLLQMILSIESWIIMTLLIIQSLLFFKDRIQWKRFRELYLVLKEKQDINHKAKT